MTDDKLRARYTMEFDWAEQWIVATDNETGASSVIAKDVDREFGPALVRAILAASATDEGPRVHKPTDRDVATAEASDWYKGYRAGLNARPAEYRPAVPEALDVEPRGFANHEDDCHCHAAVREYSLLRSKEPTE